MGGIGKISKEGMSCDNLDGNDDIEERRYGFGEGRSLVSGEHSICGCNSEERRTIRRKMEETLKYDRIWHILPFLPIEDVVKTGTLSPRWLHLWTFVPKLSFIYPASCFKDIHEFVTAVDHTLLFHKGIKIEEFSVDLVHDSSISPNLDRWVRFASPYLDRWVCFATGANVEKFWLCVSNGDPEDGERYVFPQHLYTNSSITELTLQSCVLVCNEYQ